MQETSHPDRANQAHDPSGALKGTKQRERLSRADIISVLMLTIACLIAYLITTALLEPFVNQPNDFLGGCGRQWPQCSSSGNPGT
jgi:hypothetical protein